ncbi:MAG: NnrS family protein [Bdellovibrionaceae bacterium]|nr:NnrS family protein [Pseudobdellovibrionaceae bacterium]
MSFFSVKAPVWSVGFRPFFILVLLSAIATTPVWVFQITGLSKFDFSPLSPFQWHANEMIFGFLTAAIIGFLLTASANWTGTRAIHGIQLIILFSMFLFTRIIFWTTPFENIWIYPFIGSIVPICIVFHLARLFIRTKNTRNLILIVPLSVLIFSQIFILSSDYVLGYELALFAIRFLLIVIAGRVIPFFTKSALKIEPKRNSIYLEKLTIITAFLLIFEPFYRDTSGLGHLLWIVLTVLALGLNIYRLVNWRLIHSYKVKILFILYVAYLWLPIHFFLNLASHLHWIAINSKLSIHSLSYGAMGIMILGIIHRVTLGHTGRVIQASKLTVFSYFVISVGAIMRVLGPLFAIEHYFFWIRASGILWVLAFIIMGFELIPMLLSKRVDGREF